MVVGTTRKCLSPISKDFHNDRPEFYNAALMYKDSCAALVKDSLRLLRAKHPDHRPTPTKSLDG
jgi:hypothetical protein